MKKLFILPCFLLFGELTAQTSAEFIATAEVEFAQENYENAAGYYRKALELDTAKSDYASAGQLGLCYLNLKQYPAALEQLKQSLLMGNSDKSLFNKLKTCADEMKCTECLEKAYTEIEQALPAWSPVVQDKLFYVYIGQGKNKEALDASAKVLADNPAHFNMLKNTGLLYNGLNKPDSAIVYLQRANELKPEDAVINKTLGLLFYNTCEDKLAAENKRYEKLENKGSSQYNTLLYNRQNLAKTYYTKAIKHLNAANATLNDPEITRLIGRMNQTVKAFSK